MRVNDWWTKPRDNESKGSATYEDSTSDIRVDLEVVTYCHTISKHLGFTIMCDARMGLSRLLDLFVTMCF